ncbi:uncharacterized protein, partial [Mycetomoellerius zeteki]|uniref:uncharacterized protein n=1 Tax=Mycetomoellerius zeteki TaxID=64791 RepID=UPI00084E3D53
MIWLQHFAHCITPTKENPVLLVLDNHSSHISLSTYSFCTNNYIHMLSLPPHTSHRMQPLDVSFFGPLKRAYYREANLFIKSKNLTKIQSSDLPELFGKAYNRIASIDKAVNGFKATGIYPIDPCVFEDSEFVVDHQVSAQVIFDDYIPVVSEETLVAIDNSTVTFAINKELDASSIINQHCIENEDKENENLYENKHTGQNETNKNSAVIQDFKISLTEMCPSAKKLPNPSSQQNREKQHSEILTSSPVQKMLEIKKGKKEEKARHAEQIRIKKDLQKNIKMQKDEEK